MAEPAIELKGLAPFIAKLEQIGRGSFAGAVFDSLALYVKGKVAEYPPQSRLTLKQVYGSTFRNERQRRAFFAKLRRGEIEVPYRRGISPGSEALGRKWTIERRGDYERVVGNNASYARLVQSEGQQTLYHQATGWRTVEDIAEAEQDEITRQGQRLMEEELAKYG